MTKVLKFCNNCGKAKMVKVTHNYANCCGGRVGVTAATQEQLDARQAKREEFNAMVARLFPDL